MEVCGKDYRSGKSSERIRNEGIWCDDSDRTFTAVLLKFFHLRTTLDSKIIEDTKDPQFMRFRVSRMLELARTEHRESFILHVPFLSNLHSVMLLGSLKSAMVGIFT